MYDVALCGYATTRLNFLTLENNYLGIICFIRLCYYNDNMILMIRYVETIAYIHIQSEVFSVADITALYS